CLAPEFEIHLYRVVQEGIGNILKHSGATVVRLVVHRMPDLLEITWSDNGRGFDPASAARQEGMGLARMAERVRWMGGHLEIRSQPGSGATFRISIPRPSKGSPSRAI